MLRKRIIPCLDIKDGRTVKGINFINLRDAGDAVELAKAYVKQGADELVFLDITATVENRKTLVNLVSKISEEINIPFTVGGGITTLRAVSELLEAGADKVSINSIAVKTPQFIFDVAAEFGNQCVVVAIDTKLTQKGWKVFVHGGRTETDKRTIDWIKQVEQLGAGEILLTSMSNDGTKNGFAIDITKTVCDLVTIPVIASGGAGSMQHFADVFEQTGVDAALAASVFHFGEIKIPDLKAYLKTKAIPTR